MVETVGQNLASVLPIRTIFVSENSKISLTQNDVKVTFEPHFSFLGVQNELRKLKLFVTMSVLGPFSRTLVAIRLEMLRISSPLIFRYRLQRVCQRFFYSLLLLLESIL